MAGDSLNEAKNFSKIAGSAPSFSLMGNDRPFRLLSILIVFAFLVSALFGVGLSEGSDAISSDTGSCGDGVTYTYNSSTKTLTITYTGVGSGVMDDYSHHYEQPWRDYVDDITTLSIGEGVTHIGMSSFENDRYITGSLVIPNSVTSIGVAAFRGCTGLTGSLTIPNSVTSIGEQAFSQCTGLTGSLTIPNSVTSIGEGAFSVTGHTSFVVAPDHTYFSSDEQGILYDKNKTTLLGRPMGKTGPMTIPNSVTSIGGYACFLSNNRLTGELTIPNSVTSIGDFAFFQCTGLTGSLTIPNSVTSIGEGAFAICQGLTGSLTIPNSVTSIGYGAFAASGFTGSLTIPNSVTSIGEQALSAYGVTEYIVDPDNTCYSSDEQGILYDKNKTTLLECPLGKTGPISIPNSVTSIGESAFSGCTGLTGSLTIPNSVTSIGDHAFSGCSGFTGSLIIPDSVTSIGYNTFADCTGFSGDLILPDSDTNIGEGAFVDCTSFASISIPDRNYGQNPAYGVFNGLHFYQNDKEIINYKWNDLKGKQWSNMGNGVFYCLNPATKYTISFFAGEGGSVSQSSIQVDSGSSIYADGYVIRIGSDTIRAIPDPGYSFDSWSVTRDTVLNNMTIYVYFNQGPPKYTITFIPWSGTVTPSSVQVYEGSSISVSGNVMTIGSQTITATPDPGYTFYSWSVTGGTVTSDMTINAFSYWTSEVTEYTVMFSAGIGGSVTPSSVQVYEGSSISVSGNVMTIGSQTITAVPNSGYTFDSWSMTSGTVTSNMTINASFTQTPAVTTYCVTFSTDGMGRVSPSYVYVDSGSSISVSGNVMTIGTETVTATPYYDKVFDSWSVTSGTVTSNMNIDVTFREPTAITYEVSFYAIGGGSVSPSSIQVYPGYSISASGNVIRIGSERITAEPYDNYEFDSWSVTSGYIESDMTIQAFFKEQAVGTCTVSFSAGNGGSVSPSSVQVDYGSSISASRNTIQIGNERVTATSDNNYRFNSWSVTSGTVTSDMTIRATFEAVDPEPLNPRVENGSVYISKQAAAEMGFRDASKLALTIDRVETGLSNIPSGAVCYDIGLSYDGFRVTSFSSKIDVTLEFTIPSGVNPNDLKVYYVSDNGREVDDMNGYYDRKNNAMVFSTPHLSVFVITDKMIEPLIGELRQVSISKAPTKQSYTEGDRFDPRGLVVTLRYDNHRETLEYDGNESLFSFSPSTSTPLKISDLSVNITYQEFTVNQPIVVSSSAPTPSPIGEDSIMFYVIIIVVVVLVLIVLVVLLLRRRSYT